MVARSIHIPYTPALYPPQTSPGLLMRFGSIGVWTLVNFRGAVRVKGGKS